MIEVLEAEGHSRGETGSIVLPASIIVEEFVEKDIELSENFDDSEEIHVPQRNCASVLYSCESHCPEEDADMIVQTEFCHNDDEPEIMSPTSSVKNKPNYHRHPKPPFSYIALIAMAIKDSATGKLTLAEINEYLMQRFPFFRGSYTGWRNSVRHNLSLNECFTKILRDPSRPWGKDNYWTINENSEYTFADGVFRRRRKRINRKHKKRDHKRCLRVTERSSHQKQPKGKFTGPFSIDSILGNTNQDDDNACELIPMNYSEEHLVSPATSPSESMHEHGHMVLTNTLKHDITPLLHPTTLPVTLTPLRADFKPFHTRALPAVSSASTSIKQLGSYGLASRYLDALRFQSRAKSDVGAAVFARVMPSSLDIMPSEHRVRLPWGRPMVPSRLPFSFSPTKRPNQPSAFLVENLISR